MKFAFIDSHRAEYPVTILCRVLQVSTSGYYAWRTRGPSRRAQENEQLQRRVARIYRESRETYGSPKIHQQLRQEGIRCGRNRVIRLMRLLNIAAKRRRCFKRTTQRNPARAAAPNLLNQQFETTALNQVWLADITYIPTEAGWLYLAAVMDLHSRRILGWSMDRRMTEQLTHQALTMALHSRQIAAGRLVHHSDRGSQYTSDKYQTLLDDHTIGVSMSGRGNCYDNAPMESFFSLLKTELIHHVRFPTRAAARTAIFDYIEVFYNRQRIHSAIDYMAPVAYEQQSAQLLFNEGKTTLSPLQVRL